MRGSGWQELFGPARLRTDGGETVSARLGGVGHRIVRLGLRDADAVLIREAAATGERLDLRMGQGEGVWIPVSDLHFGRAHGFGQNSLRSLLLTPGRDLDAEALAGFRRVAPLVVAADAPEVLSRLRALPSLAGHAVVPLEELPESGAVGALLLGCGSEPPRAERIREQIRRFPGLRAVLFRTPGHDGSGWGDLLDEVFFAASGWPKDARLGPLIASAVQDAWFRQLFRELCPAEETEDGLPPFAWHDGGLISRRRAAWQRLGDLGARAEHRLLGTRPAVFAVDEWAEALIGPQPATEGAWAESPAVGLIALAARAGIPVLERRPEDSPFFDPDLDRAEGAGPDLLAVPVRDPTGTRLGVIAVHPAEPTESLDPALMRKAQLLAAEFAPALLSLRAESLPEEDGSADRSLFRSEAIEEYRRSESSSAILNVSERWGRWIVGGLIAFLFAFGLFLAFGKASEHAEGSAVVRSLDRVPVVANESGTVAALRLDPGAPVIPGEVIGTLYDAAELAQVERLEHEYEDELVRLLRNPEDPGAGSGLAALRSTSEAARAALDQRQLTAPVGGTLADVRVRVGALVAPGQTVATIRTGDAGFEIVAAVPGNFRPLLRAGIPVVAELDQFPGSRFHLTAGFVNPEVVGAEEARALMGPLLLPPEAGGEAVSLVHADLPRVLVSSTGQEYPLFDGMRGSVRIPVREQRFIVTLWPALARSE